MLAKISQKILRTLGSASTPRTKLALIVRSDLKMSKGKTAAQTAHAAVICFTAAQQNQTKKPLLDAWYEAGQPKIVLRVDNYEDILSLREKAKAAGITVALVRDAGHTQLVPGTATVLGIGPDINEQVDELVKHLKLL